MKVPGIAGESDTETNPAISRTVDGIVSRYRPGAFTESTSNSFPVNVYETVVPLLFVTYAEEEVNEAGTKPVNGA